ncbi:MAG TPA: hypothetical protein VMA35_14060 [Candidatus Sulfopaludibacter sp.]|nr:hypothetical protein [Candidatus Sulfopaludibacter sp.]
MKLKTFALFALLTLSIPLSTASVQVTAASRGLKVRDVRAMLARESAAYRAAHFPHGELPPKHGWRGEHPLRYGLETEPVPGGVGYGFYFRDYRLLWTKSTVADYYVIAPTYLGQPVSYFYLTSSCRAQLGTESLIAYEGSGDAQFWIYDWSLTNANPWQVMIDLPTANRQYLTMRPDEFGVTRQMVHIRNGTYYEGFSSGLYYWENQVLLFNFVQDTWDLVYSHAYTTANLTDNTYIGGDGTGFWGPIIETFDTYTSVNTVGFDLIRLFQDGSPSPQWLTSVNSYPQQSPPWQLLSIAPDTSFTAAVSPTTLPANTNQFGTLCVSADTAAAGFSLNPPANAGMISPYWIVTPDGGRWENTVAALPPGTYTIAFAPLSGLFAPGPQNVSILNGTVTMAQANYVPPLNMILSGGNVVLTWPTNIAGFNLESATNLTGAAWSVVIPAPVVINGLNTVTNPVSGGRTFFRLSE